MEIEHVPVLLDEVVEALNPQPEHLYIDGTLGGGGHTEALLERGARVLAFDWDLSTIEFVREKLHNYGTRVQYVHENYAEMSKHAPAFGFEPVDGIVLDLGLSSRQLENPQRGFSFQHDGPLDMRFDTRNPHTAADLVNTLTAEALADLFWRYGEEKQSRPIARAIVASRPLRTTRELAAVIAGAVGRRGQKRGLHPATRVFQALRIAVNRELEAVEKGLAAAIELLKPGGRLAVISFHSLEDRLVKETFRTLSDPYYNVPREILHVDTSRRVLERITRKPITPSAAEIARNPRSRSAKLRVAEKLNPADGA